MSTDETNAYLQAKMQQQAQGGQELSEPQKKISATKATKKAQTQPDEQPQPMLDVQAIQQMLEDVVHAELQNLHIEQPQPLDMQAFQQVMQSVVRAELQPIQTTLTLLANAVQAQAEALTGEDDEEMEDDDDDRLLPTASSHNTDEEMEDEREFPNNEETEDREDDDDLVENLPRPPEPPTHKLRRTGPESILLGGIHPSAGIRRWEQQHEV